VFVYLLDLQIHIGVGSVTLGYCIRGTKCQWLAIV